jgi:hypothetical protein
MENTRPKTFVFVLMPFDKEFDDIYALGIKKACENAGAYAERVDEQIFEGRILERIYNQIAKADIIVADMTGRNPNVFYETGYAHALGKRVILLAQNISDIPFDLKDYPHIVYEKRIVDLIPELEKRVRWFIEHPATGKVIIGPQIEFYIGAESILKNPTLSLVTPERHEETYFKIDAHNSIEREIKTANYEVGLITSKKIRSSSVDYSSEGNNVINLPSDKLLHLLGKHFSVLPGSWRSFIIGFTGTSKWAVGDEEEMILRTFSSEGTKDYPFKFQFVSKSS